MRATGQSGDWVGIVDSGVGEALEATRHFRVQADLRQEITLERLSAFEALLRSLLAVQPPLTEVEINGSVEALLSEQALSAEAHRAGETRVSVLLATTAILETLRVGYEIAMNGEVVS